MPETRTVFEGLSRVEILLWYGLIVVSTSVFAWGAVQLGLKYRRGRRDRIDRPVERAATMARLVFAHTSIKRRDRRVGVAHALVFYGFLLLFIGTTILGIQTDFTAPVFGWKFWQGAFYLGYKLVLDIAGLMLLVGLSVLGSTRFFRRPFRLDYWRPDRPATESDRTAYRVGDVTFLSTLFFLVVTGFLLEGLWLAQTHPPFAIWSPVGWVVGGFLADLGLTGGAAELAHHIVWWIHGVTALTFVASIPFTKAVHMVVAPANLTVRDPRAGKVLPPPDEGGGVQGGEGSEEPTGYRVLADFSWRHLLSLDACTKCGKCHAACPAVAGGYPLSPRDLVLDLREAAERAYGAHAQLGLGPAVEPLAALVPSVLRPETLWSCTQCMACVEICPVGIEHVPMINQLRRRLVEEGEMDPLLQSTFETIHKSGNSFGEQRRKRGRWASELEVPVKDIRKEPAELLWFVGDYASFDPRNQRATRALARILQEAGVDFGILFDAERTGGCDVRRAGEEGLFASLAEQNVQAIGACEFDRIFSSDPHSFHTLRNEYPRYGGNWTVLHHSQLLLELLRSGRLTPRRRLGYRVTYHDPCTLGRYNGVYEEPREVLRALGVELVEMPRNRDNSLCCGAGGGRIWMKELRREGARRTSELRIDEAVALGSLDYFVVACPKDVTMYEDAIKTAGHQDALQLRELSELVLEALGLPEATEESVAAAPA